MIFKKCKMRAGHDNHDPLSTPQAKKQTLLAVNRIPNLDNDIRTSINDVDNPVSNGAKCQPEITTKNLVDSNDKYC
jgi:hypothetical protein